MDALARLSYRPTNSMRRQTVGRNSNEEIITSKTTQILLDNGFVDRRAAPNTFSVGTVYRGTPPKCESTIGNLVETRSLGIGQFLVSHGLLESGGLLPKET